MKTFKPVVVRKIVKSFLILGIMFIVNPLCHANLNDASISINKNYKIKRTSDGTVRLYSYNEQGETEEEFVFTKFHADVLLLLYRKVAMKNIVKSMSEKYSLSEIDARRAVKITLNELESYDLIIRK